MNNIDLSQTPTEPDSTADLARSNPPALPALTYRGGKYGPTIQRMLASLSTQDALARLNRDADNDWSIALFSAWSIVTDVLGFYQERITNEGYIRTATERRSVLALARALGYDWRPGLAATVDLALTVAPDDQDQPQRIPPIAQGKAVQSTPAEGKLPQIFETSAEAEVRTEWNLLFPYVGLKATEAGQSEPFLTDVTSMRIANYRSDLQKGDLILLVDQFNLEPTADPMQPAWVLGILDEVVADPQKPYTVIRWTIADHFGDEIQQPALFVFRQKAALFGYARGAVYFDGEVAPPPPAPAGATTNGKTNGPGTPGATTPEKAPTVTGNPAPTAAQPTAPLTPTQANVTTGSNLENKPNGKDKPAIDESPTPPKVAHWTPRTLSLPNLDINAFVANSKGVIFAGTKRDLFRSVDNGESWQAVGIDPVGRAVTALTLDADDNLFAGSSTGGIYLSYDSGDNWTPVSGDAVAPEVKVTKDPKGETFKVDPPEMLPKAPILALEFGKNQAGKDVLYALAGKDLFSSTDKGKTWGPPIEPGDELPATQQRVSAADQRAAMVNAAKGFLALARLQGLEKIVTPVAQGVGLTKWAGLDLWGFLSAMVNKAPPGANAVRAVAVATPGKKSTVVVGTDAGKFTLKQKTRRWLVAVVIVLLVLFQQFLINHGKLGAPAVELAGTGVMDVRATATATKGITATTALVTQGMLQLKTQPPIKTQTIYTLTLTGRGTLPATVDDKKKMVIATGKLPFTGSMFTNTVTTTSAVTLSALTTFTSTLASDRDIVGTLFALTTTQAVSVNLRLTATTIVTGAGGIWPPVVILSSKVITGTVTPAAPLPETSRFEWLNTIWQSASDLLQTTVIASWNAGKGFLSDLWAALPAWIKAILTPINDYLIQPVIKFVDTYLIKPLLNDTAATLLDISAIILGVLALLLAWIYADHKMSNRKTVRLEGPVNALAIGANGQIFAGTAQGVFRSLADDPNASWWTKATRMLIRRAFPDVPMEPINQGWTKIDPDSQAELTPDIRTLAFTNTNALLAGTADGRIFRLSDPSAELDPNVIAETTVNADASVKPDPNAKPAALVKWERYDQGIVEKEKEDEEAFKSNLKLVRTMAITPMGQFVAGGMGADKVEDRWFTAQFSVLKTSTNQKIKIAEIDLDTIYPNLKTGSWLVIRQPTTEMTKQGKPVMKYARYWVRDVLRVRSQDFVTAGEFTRALVQYDDRLIDFSRTRCEVLMQSDAVDLFDNRPVQGQWLYLKGNVPDLNAGHRLIVNGKQKLASIIILMKDALRADNNLAWRTLERGDILHVVTIPTPKTFALALETMPDVLWSDDKLARRTVEKDDVFQIVAMPYPVETAASTTATLPDPAPPAAAPTPGFRWRLRTRDGFVGTVDATKEQIRCAAGFRWRLRTRDGFVGTVDASKEQIRWVLPPEAEPEVSEVVTVLLSETINLADEADTQAGLDYTHDRVTITKVKLQSDLAYLYDRATVTVFGNIVPATQGQTVKDEVLGSGSGMQANERFMLQERPLTYVSAADDQGYAGEITVKVNNIEWQQERYLFGLTRDRRAYIVRQDALDNTYITFGDGNQGARLPTGTEQVTATYRIGIGSDGNVPPYTINQPQTLPSAVRQVTNPLPASGGVGPDTTDDVRLRAPLSVRIMDRIVALADYEDYVRLYAGIGRVQLKRFGVGPSLLLHFTVADSNGNPIPEGDLLANLRQSIDERRAVATPRIQIDSYEPLFFDLKAKLLIYPEHKGRVRELEQIARQKLLTAFSFAARTFGQDVAESEVVALLQAIPGVAAVDSVGLQYATKAQPDAPPPPEPLPAQIARIENDSIRPAQLLLLNPGTNGIDLPIATTNEPTIVLNMPEVLA